MQMLSVGTLYHQDRTSWPDAYEFSYIGAGHQLRLFVGDLKPHEIEAVRTGEAQFALSIIDDIIFFHFRIEPAFGWSDCPFTIHLTDLKAELPELDYRKAFGAPLTLILVEATTGIVKVLRMVAMSHSFTMKLHRAIHEQASKPFDLADYDERLRLIYAGHTSVDLVRKSVVKFTAGLADESDPLVSVQGG